MRVSLEGMMEGVWVVEVVLLPLLLKEGDDIDIDNFNVARAAFISRSVIIDTTSALSGIRHHQERRLRHLTAKLCSTRGARSETVFGWGLVVGVRWGRL